MTVTGPPPRGRAHIGQRLGSRPRATAALCGVTAMLVALVLAVSAAAASASVGSYGLTFDPTHAVLVSMNGSDSTGQGTENNPYRTIGRGIQVAAALHENVYVAGSPSAYVESVVAQSNVGVYGGFDPSTWTESPSETTTIQALDGSEQAVLASGTTNVVLYRLVLKGPRGVYGSRAQTNSYGLRAINGSSVALLAVTATGGPAASGLNGGTPNNPLAVGAAGANGSPPSTSNCPNPPSGGAGGSGASGDNGGAGGAGGSDAGGTPLNGSPGIDGLPNGSNLGGAGGQAENGGSPNSNQNGQSGGSGANGVAGQPGSGGSDQSGSHSTDPMDWYGADGQPGHTGQPGHGGGGGGGGGGRHRECFLCSYDTAGGSGGGGGGGGQGGGGGGGGQAGGASFGVFLEASTLVADDSSLVGGTGGNGGNGAAGQPGASGGSGGSSADIISCSLSTTPGGNGGNGGQGGTGGTGGGGAGGPSAAIDEGPNASFALRNTSTASGQPGQPGYSGGSPASIGQGSETVPAGATSNTTQDFDHDGLPDVADLCPTVPGGPSDLSHDGCPGSPSPLPQNTGRPTIDGSAVEGQTLTEGAASWSNGPSKFVYQWARCDASGGNCAPAPGATAATYTLGPADVGSTLEVSEVAWNNVGESAPAWSDPTTPVKSALPVNLAVPSVVGPPVAGQILAVQRGVWANGPTTFQYQWLRCDANGASCQPIAGQTGLTYGITGEDVGSTLEVKEVAANGWGAGAPVTSAATSQIADAPLSVQAFALVGTVGGIVPGPVASFSQPGASYAAPGSYAVTISWGDGSSSPGSVLPGKSGGYLVEGSHAYSRSGNYSLTVRVQAATGATAVSVNRVSVFAAAVCPKGSGAKGHNCLGDISLPAGCLTPGAKLRVSIPSAHGIRRVSYSIAGGQRSINGSGRRFAAALPTTGLASGAHNLTARITFRSGHPPKLSKTRPFAIC